MLNMTRKTFLIPAATMLFACASVHAQQQQAPPPQSQDGSSATQSVADAARHAKAQKSDSSSQAAPAKPRVFTNDNIPTTGGISTVGESASGGSGSGDNANGANPDDPTKHEEKKEGATKSLGANDEKGWRALFQDLRHKLDQDQQDLDISQRELGKDDVQFYQDPVKGMQQGLTRSDINDKTAKIDSLKAKIQADQQAISNAEDQLRAAGGDPGWAR
jgi:hypothetical protein